MLTWWCTSPPSPRTSPLRPVKVPSSSSRSPPTVFADASRRSRLFVARRNGVGIYTVTAMLSSARLARPVHRLASRRASPSLRGRRSPRTTRSQTRLAARVAEPPRPPLASHDPFTDSPRGARRRASTAAARLARPVHRLASRRASPSLHGRRSARTTRSQTRLPARVAEPPRPPLGSHDPFTDSPPGPRRRASPPPTLPARPLAQLPPPRPAQPRPTHPLRGAL